MKPADLIHCMNRCLRVLVLIGVFFWSASQTVPLFAQDAPAPAAAEGAAAAAAPAGEAGKEAPKPRTFWQTIHEGGWIMWPLIIISMWCTALIIEGFIRIRLVNFAPPDVVQQLKAAFAEENYQQAWRVCKSKSSFLTNILRYGLERIGRGRSACETAISEHSLKESMALRTKISYLSTIGVISPMVGLLGTVTGMIKAFAALGQSGIADPSKLAAAIGEVLIATATGLLVAIPAFFLYYFFRNRLQMITVMAEDVMNQLMTDIKYEELEGIKIGDTMEAQLAAGTAQTTPSGRILPPAAAAAPAAVSDAGKQVSQAVAGVTIACPQCNAPITMGAAKCASCGTELQWT